MDQASRSRVKDHWSQVMIRVTVSGHWSGVAGQRSSVTGQGSLVRDNWSGITGQRQGSVVKGHLSRVIIKGQRVWMSWLV